MIVAILQITVIIIYQELCKVNISQFLSQKIVEAETITPYFISRAIYHSSSSLLTHEFVPIGISIIKFV